jgi:hypothetical protein
MCPLQVSLVSEKHRLRAAVACFRSFAEAERGKTFRNQLAGDHALSCVLKRTWLSWKHLWYQMRPIYSAWVPVEQRPKKGIGAEICKIEGTAQYFVKSLDESGAAAESGMLNIGDVITAIDDWSISGAEFDFVSSLISGPEGTPIIVHGVRGPDKQRFRAQIHRGEKRYIMPTASDTMASTAQGADGGGGCAKMQRALETMLDLQRRYFAVRTAFDSWALRWFETRRLMEIEQACHVTTLRGAVRHLHAMAQMSAEARQQQRMRFLKLSNFNKQRQHVCLIRTVSRWRVLSHKNRLTDDMIQRCTRPRTLVEDRESVRLAFVTWVEHFRRQISTAALLRTVNQRFDRMRCWECLNLWREALRMLRFRALRATRLSVSCAHRLQRCIYGLMYLNLVKWVRVTELQRQYASRMSEMRGCRCVRMCRSAFRLWEVRILIIGRASARCNLHGTDWCGFGSNGFARCLM